MHASEFDKLNFQIGQEYLEPVGYRYENSNWHYLTEDWQLSFILGKDKNASHFQVKFLTVALRHRKVPIGDGKIKLVPYNNIDLASPVQISPFLLSEFIKSGCNPASWKYVNPRSNKGRHKNTYYPLYYGGEENFSQQSIQTFGADVITEDTSTDLLRDAIIDVSKHGVKWAKFLTPAEIVNQLKTNGDNWWVENQWIDAYSETFLLPR